LLACGVLLPAVLSANQNLTIQKQKLDQLGQDIDRAIETSQGVQNGVLRGLRQETVQMPSAVAKQALARSWERREEIISLIDKQNGNTTLSGRGAGKSGVQLGTREGTGDLSQEVSAGDMEVEATAYCLTGRTATGERTRRGIIAVDPRVIPLGSRTYVDGYGEAIAADTGGVIKGRRIDIWLPDCQAAREYGRQKTTLQILK